MNYLWAGMILLGIVYGAFQGRLPEVSEAALSSAKEAITLCITMTGIMAFWVGLMKIAERAGIIKSAEKKLRPFLRFFFPDIPPEHEANQYLAMNIIANIFGLGWAATPAGLKAMKALEKLEQERGNPEYLEEKHFFAGGRTASREMCDFLILNISSLQLIPVSILAYRSQYGSSNPVAVVAPAILATTVGTAVAILFCKFIHIKQKIQTK